MRNSKQRGFAIVLVVALIVMCIAWNGERRDRKRLESDTEVLRQQLQELQYSVNNLSNQLQLQQSAETYGDIAYGKLHPENGTMEVRFFVYPGNEDRAMTATVTYGGEMVELTRTQGYYEGVVEYPLEGKAVDVYARVYSANGEEQLEIGTICPENWWTTHVKGMFNGYQMSGNGRITMAGELDYLLDVPEELTEARFVAGDKEWELAAEESGRTEVQFSISYESETAYLEMIGQSGTTYRLYLPLYVYVYESEIKEWSEEDEAWKEEPKDTFDQGGYLLIVTPDGSSYKLLADMWLVNLLAEQ